LTAPPPVTCILLMFLAIPSSKNRVEIKKYL